MSRSVFLSILQLLMCDDPSNLSDENRLEIITWVDRMCQDASYDNWIEAYMDNCKCMPESFQVRN